LSSTTPWFEGYSPVKIEANDGSVQSVRLKAL